jgi:heterodisulfide reductase subunit A-like polyferredoxin
VKKGTLPSPYVLGPARPELHNLATAKRILASVQVTADPFRDDGGKSMTEVIATNETILVVGGGISGMTAALEAAETGKRVVLVEKRPYLGGGSPSYTNISRSCASPRAVWRSISAALR